MGGLVLGGLAAPAILCAQPSPPARSLTIAAAAETTSLDPHFQDHDPTITVQRHVYEFLVGQGPRMELVPELAESWRARDPLTWEFRLRRGVVWHDGAPFTAADVIASLKRVPTVENSPSSFVPYVRQITAMEAEDSHTLVLRTATPFPLMPNYMGAVMIIPARLQAAKTADFNTLAAAVGTGPYRVVDYVRGQRVVLEANPRHWAGPPANPRVVFRFITATGSRVAALMAGDVDLIEQPPPVDIPALRANPRTRVWESVGNRVVYFGLDFHRDRAAGVAAPDGSAIANPFRDLRVRQALSLAINRETICSRVIEGLAAPANQMVAAGVFGHDPAIPPAAYDPDRAKQLLAQAGLPDGFRMTIHGTSDRLVNDEKVLQALAQMYARIGVRAEVDAMLSTAFFPRVGRLEFSFFFNSWGAGSSGGVTTIRTALATYDDEKGMGRGNRGRYSNPEVDRRIAAALETIDDAERERLTREATAIAMADVAVIPTHWTKNLWASRAGLAYEPRMDGFTLATGVRTTG
ncbi:MAG: ABC transporter substrate-binding protein [Novosphingobium sp.]|nr:ABC transporter substrate-binding protein [Novosphingobium sp.]